MGKPKNTGFTLLELIIFIAVAGMILPAVLLAFRESVMELETPLITDQVNGLAREKMEEFLQYDYDDPSLPFGFGSDAVTLGGKTFSRIWVVLPARPVPGFPFTFLDTGYKRIVLGAWSTAPSRSVILETLVTRKCLPGIDKTAILSSKSSW